MAPALAVRRMLWREAAERLLIEEAQANVENAPQVGRGKSEVPDLGREVAPEKSGVGE